MLHDLLLLLSLYRLLCRILESNALLVGSLEQGYHLFPSLQHDLHLGTDGLLELLENLERLVEACGTYGKGVVFHLSVELRFEESGKGNAVVKFDFPRF